MSELKKWRVTGPDGFEFFTPPFDNEAEAMEDAFVASILTAPYVMRQAGYRAEPIEEPKMVTVRADVLERAENLLCNFEATAWDGDPMRRSDDEMCMAACKVIDDIRAALESAK